MKNNQESTYAEFVSVLLNPGGEVLQRITADQLEKLHCAVGIDGEAGELSDAIKKHVFYDQPLDKANVLEESGDILFYLTGLLSACGFTLEDAMQANRNKLSVRYANGYSHKAAKERADKQ